MSVIPGFTKGQSDNLPKIDSMSMFSFLGKNPDFMGAEIRGIKTKRSGRESYGDNAVGYVQVRRDGNLCTVKAKVTPEHSLRKKAYDVTLLCNEVEEEILSVTCDSCAASLGGCKHAIALITWLHRRSEEPAVTSVFCYWKASRLSAVGKAEKFIKAKNLVKNNIQPLPPSDGSFLNKVAQKSRNEAKYDSVLTKYFKELADVEGLSIHNLLTNFLETTSTSTADEFINYCSCNMSETDCNTAAHETIEQSESALWFELRYTRITASKAHEAAHCHTLEGCLVETVLGAISLKDTAAMTRGQKLEKKVRKEVEKIKKIQIHKCGFRTSPEYPVMGASPDGISNEFVVEIKCPSTEKTVNNYVKNNIITEKYKVQVQMQMFFWKKKQALFCIAAADFETSKEVNILTVDFDEQYCLDILKKCIIFWKNAIFPLLKKSLN
ncbi:hypothetical protein AVEN_161419-1 [Araneus ventricosus]|uniref:YqaJ viral recombinase domain-containing protein n=1 Tax=Araneus ventricosus TaxID=182803 RepID=A0A4Y2JZ54_ARAVE|nr:hypothetical protein AVEN_161419-1 [Araneus ventricosus]